jgi:hypothetical protein
VGKAGEERVESYPPSQRTTGLTVDECANNQYATARCRPEAEADNRVVAEGEDGYDHRTTGLPVGLHWSYLDIKCRIPKIVKFNDSVVFFV